MGINLETLQSQWMIMWGKVLPYANLAAGGIATTTLGLSLATDYWIYTNEPYPIVLNETMQLTTITPLTSHAGLWKQCPYYEFDGEIFQEPCVPIDYLRQEAGRIDNVDITTSINRAIRSVVPLPIAAAVVILVAMLMNVIGNFKKDGKTLASAMLYAFGSLLTGAGVIMYIAAVNDEISHRPAPKSKDLIFKYSYGWSFYFACIAFFASNTSAVLCTTVYLQTREGSIVKLVPGAARKLQSTDESEQNDHVVAFSVCETSPQLGFQRQGNGASHSPAYGSSTVIL